MKSTIIALVALTCALAKTDNVSAQYSATVEIGNHVECVLPQIVGTTEVLMPCSSPAGFGDLAIGTIALITYSPGSCASFCMEGTDVDISAYTVQSSSAGIEENKLATFIKVFPQPTSGIFTVESSQSIEIIELYSTQGELILTKNGQETNTIDITSFESGIYMLKVKTSKGEKVLKVSKM